MPYGEGKPIMDFRLRKQLAEAFGHDNRWFCSQAHGRKVDDPDVLLTYFVRSGGAADFCRRYEHVISAGKGDSMAP